MSTTRKLKFQNYHADASSHIGDSGTLFFDPTTTTLRLGDGETPGGNPVGGSSSLPIVTITYADQSQSANNSVGAIFDSGINWSQPGGADVLFTVTSDDTLEISGTLQFYNSLVATTAGNNQSGENGVRFLVDEIDSDFVVIAYATNASGTAYSAPASGSGRPLCLAAGTLIALSDGTHKPIEHITYADDLLVWDFDSGCFAESKPLWIMRPSSVRSYNELVFNDGTTLNTVGQHRIFNQQVGKFTYPLTDDSPIGTTTFNEYSRDITLIAKRVVESPTISYNIISDYHLNLFANGVLTSNSFNNIYPIVDMRFVKDDRVLGFYPDISDILHRGMRLAEQQIDGTTVRRYIKRMLTSDKRALEKA